MKNIPFIAFLFFLQNSNVFAEEQKIIESDRQLFTPIKKRMTYRNAQKLCTSLNINNQKAWRLADSFDDLKPMLRADREMQEWRYQDVSFSFKPNEPHFFYCMKDLGGKAKIKTVEKVQQYVQTQEPKKTPEIEESQKSWIEEQRKIDERSRRVIKESNAYQESLNTNSTVEIKSSIQTKKRFFKDSNLSECTDQDLTNCYAHLKIDTGSFEGELGNGTFEGKGLIVYNNDGAFVGNFHNNEFISGMEIYTNANEFFRLRDDAIEKDLSDNDRQKYIFNSFKGKYYLGTYKNNKRDGQGLYVDSIEGVSQNGSWKNDEFISGETKNFPQNNSSQANFNLSGQSQCQVYGFQKGTNAFAQCLMQIDIAQRQADIEKQSRVKLEQRCELARANGFTQQTRTGNFVENLQLATQAYNNCIAGLPPPKSGLINCNVSGNNVTCFAQ
jgi:hypothetical protein